MCWRTTSALTRVGIVAALTAAAVASLLPASSAARGSACGRAGMAPQQASMHDLRQDLLCLINFARRNHGMPTLRYSEDLRRAASEHSTDMVERGYFAHTGSGGSDVIARVSRAGYGGFSVVGENIGWGPGRRYGSANAMFERWMHSPGHRANILNPSYRDFGVGVSRGSPAGGGRGAATYTLDLGSRG